MEVYIDGVTYVPESEIPELTDDRLKKCLAVLTEMRYFNQGHKMMGLAYNAIEALAPDIAELSSNDSQAAYDLFNGED